MHRTASVNEYSTRYSPAIDATSTTDADKWRKQSKTNRQGSSGNTVTEWPESQAVNHEPTTPGQYLSNREGDLQVLAREIYNERLEFGVAFEQARKDLPLSTYTEAYWKSDLHNLLRFLSLRMDHHAQLEIREFANVIGVDFIERLFPFSWEAFNDFDMRRDATLLTSQVKQIIQAAQSHLEVHSGAYTVAHLAKVAFKSAFLTKAEQFGWTEKSGERTEAIAVLSNLGLLTAEDLKDPNL